MNDIAGLREQRTASDIPRTLLVLAGWFFVAVWLGVSGALRAQGGPPLGIAAAIVLPLIAFALDRRFGSPVLGGFQRLDLPALIGLQTFRIVGVIFIVAWLGGTLPGGFALPAGIGDVAIGLTAPLVASAVADRRPHHVALARLWNVLGAADLITAVGSGVLHGHSPIGLLAGPVGTDGMAAYPLSLIPTFLVPLAFMLHLCTFRALAAQRNRPGIV